LEEPAEDGSFRTRVKVWWQHDVRKAKRRKLTKFFFFTIALGFIPIVSGRFGAADIYFAAVVIIVAGVAEMVFDRRMAGKVDTVVLVYLCLSFIFSIYGAIQYGHDQRGATLFEAPPTSSRVVEDGKNMELPIIPSGYLLIAGVFLGASAAYFSEAPVGSNSRQSVGADQ
jgi:hypothetical protein